MMNSFSYISGAYGVALFILSSFGVSSFIQRRRLRQEKARVSDK